MTADRRLAGGIAALCLFWSACFHHTRDWNSASRLLLTHALVQNHSVEVTPFVAVDGMLVRDPPTKDLASPDRRRHFCDKPPGQSFAGAGFFFLLRSSGIADDHPLARDFEASRPERLSHRRTDQLLTIATSGLAAAAASALVFLMLRRWGSGRPAATVAAIGLTFASPWQVYGTLYYGHVLAGFLSLLSLDFLSRAIEGDRRNLLAFFAGVFAGLAVVTEYTLATYVISVCLVGIVVGVKQLITDAGRNRGGAATAFAFLLGGFGPAILLGFYHWSVTGDPFVPAYRYEVEPIFAAVHAKGGGIPLTSLQPNALRELLAGSSIGLFLFAPAVVWAIPGIVMLLRDRFWLGGMILLTAATLVLAIACFPNWNGGLATGPRLVVPALPLMFVAVGWAWHIASQSRLGRLLLLVTAPFVMAAWILNTAMNAAGARKPFDSSIGEFLLEMHASPHRERHLGDWLLSTFGIDADATTSLVVLLVVGLLGVIFVLRRAIRQDV
jgi:hypothetical protein